jgi:hypothetical protein
MIKHLKYLRYVVRHKWFVGKACFRRGLILQGVCHDWSKFLPSEWAAYAQYFYGGNGKNHPPTEQASFDQAWLFHQHRNPHHWQYWVLREDSGATKILEMPRACVLEMLADWEGAGLAITGKREFRAWYLKNQGQIWLHPKTKELVESLLLQEP